MATDLYKVLGIKNNASTTTIKKAYHKLAIRFHPDKNTSPQAEEHFKDISKAYAILSDRKQRSMYDRFIASDHMAKVLVDVKKFEVSAFNTSNSEHEQPAQYHPDNVHEIFVSLQEIDRGSVRRVKILRTITTSDNQSYTEEKVFKVTIKRGIKADSKIIFHNEGNRSDGKPPADVVFIIRDKPHALFKRQGADLKLEVNISLRQALCGTFVEVHTLQGDRVLLSTQNEIITPQTVKLIAQRGLPLPKQPHKRGDLLIAFNIQFPEQLSPDCKNQLSKLLQNPKDNESKKV